MQKLYKYCILLQRLSWRHRVSCRYSDITSNKESHCHSCEASTQYCHYL